jgi:protein SCO1
MSPWTKEENARENMPRISIAVVVAITVALLVAVPGRGPSGSEAKRRGDNGAARKGEKVDYLPGMSLIDQNGKTVSLTSLKGRPVLISFIHASCKGACQMMTAKMKMVAQSLGSKFDSSVTMVSITTDPAHDGPRQLLAYAKNEGADAAGWLFLTGKPKEVGRVLALYHVPMEGPDDSMTHDFDLFLVAPDGRETRQYQGMKVAPDVVASDIRKTSAYR